MADTQSTTPAEQRETVTLLRSNQAALSSLSSGLLGIQQRVNVLGGSLTQISTQITQSSTLENIKVRQEQDQERKLAEQSVREGKESVIERKIQGALVAPVQAVAQKAQGVLERLKGFFFTLLAGWLTNQGIEAIRAYQQGATQKLEQIKNSILSTLGVVGGIFLLVSGGFTRILGLMGNFAKTVLGAVTGAIFVKPLQMLARAAGIGAGGAAAAAGPKPGVRGPGLIGGIISGVGGLMNLRSGENVDAGVNAAGFIPGPVGAGARILSLADDLAEMFGVRGGAGLLGNTPRGGNEKANDKPTTTAKTTPTETKMGAPAPASPAPTTTTTSTVEQPAGQTAATSVPPSPEMVKNFEMAWQYRNNPMARGRIESAWGQMSAEEKQQAITWAQSKGYDWSEMKLPAPATTAQVQSTASQTLSAKMEATAPLPEPEPTVVAAPTPPSQMSQPTSQGSGAGTQVPAISSSNPENFYIMYSQMQYNVVM